MFLDVITFLSLNGLREIKYHHIITPSNLANPLILILFPIIDLKLIIDIANELEASFINLWKVFLDL